MIVIRGDSFALQSGASHLQVRCDSARYAQREIGEVLMSIFRRTVMVSYKLQKQLAITICAASVVMTWVPALSADGDSPLDPYFSNRAANTVLER